jgi:IS30 family transposase
MSVDHSAIVAALKAGESQNAVARRLGCGPATVNRVAKRNGLECHSPKNQAAEAEITAALADYSIERRLALLNKVFAKAEELIDTATTPHKLQALAIAIGILTDKRRLEDGEVTARTEVSGGDARERIASRLDELASRRRTTDAA